jgi:hypothetical protein
MTPSLKAAIDQPQRAQRTQSGQTATKWKKTESWPDIFISGWERDGLHPPGNRARLTNRLFFSAPQWSNLFGDCEQIAGHEDFNRGFRG